MDIRILIAAGAILLSGPLHAQVNVAFEKPVHEAGEPFGIGVAEPGVAPSTVTDGIFLSEPPPPENLSPWYLGSWWVDGVCMGPPPPPPPEPQAPFTDSEPPPPEPCALEIDLQGEFRIFSLVFQGDSNDEYSIEYWDHGAGGWQPVWLVPAVDGEGLSTRPEEFLDPPIIAHNFRIVGIGGDGQYGVSELQAFGEVFDPCVEGGGTRVNFNCSPEEREFETHVTAGDICYRFEFSCDEFVEGGFDACVLPDGFFDFGMGTSLPPEPGEPPPVPPHCGFGGGHYLNDKVEHSCSLDGQGKAQLEVKQVGMVHCTR
jgi:hypothetical protein